MTQFVISWYITFNPWTCLNVRCVTLNEDLRLLGRETLSPAIMLALVLQGHSSSYFFLYPHTQSLLVQCLFSQTPCPWNRPCKGPLLTSLHFQLLLLSTSKGQYSLDHSAYSYSFVQVLVPKFHPSISISILHATLHFLPWRWRSQVPLKRRYCTCLPNYLLLHQRRQQSS